MSAEVRYLPSHQVITPQVPTDLYVADLEAKIIQLTAAALFERAGTSVLAMAFAQALVIYQSHRRHRVERIDIAVEAGRYMQRIETFMRTLPPRALTELRHPAIGRDRVQQQTVFTRAVAAHTSAVADG